MGMEVERDEELSYFSEELKQTITHPHPVYSVSIDVCTYVLS
jgi:hypothetical protein